MADFRGILNGRLASRLSEIDLTCTAQTEDYQTKTQEILKSNHRYLKCQNHPKIPQLV